MCEEKMGLSETPVGGYESLKEACRKMLDKRNWYGLNPHKVKRLCEEYERLRDTNKDLARIIGCLEPNEEGKPSCGPPSGELCICCKALAESEVT